MPVKKNQFKLVVFDLTGRSPVSGRSGNTFIRLGKWYGFAEEYQNNFWLERFHTKNFVSVMPRSGKE
jgi:hypothetical protein